MTLGSLLRGCFGYKSKSDTVLLGVNESPSQNSVVLSKKLEVVVKSQDLSESSSINSSPPLKQNKALCVVSKHTYSISNDIPYPSLETPDEVIIKTRAVGLNPIDWKSVDYNFCMPSFPWIGGRELAGEVAQVGANVKGFKVGDRVWASKLFIFFPLKHYAFMSSVSRG